MPVKLLFTGNANSTVTFSFSSSSDNTSWAYVCVEGKASEISSTSNSGSSNVISGKWGFIFGGRDSSSPTIYYNKSTIVIKPAELTLGATTHHNREMWIEAIKLLDDTEITSTVSLYDTYAGAGAVGVS